MSELKAVHAFDVYEAYTKTGDDDAAQVYLKSEADKVIAEKDAVIAKLKAKLEEAKNETNYWCNNLKVFAQKKDAVIAELKADYKEACDRLQTANLIKDEQLAATRHSKYKRCLAMAMWCDARADWYYGIGESLRNRVEFYIKWHKRWLELAEQFKEAK